ncbi:MAG: HAMP domain-containing histidine kinase [Solirubrobacterales bacterium]|nr:HAMP domain-containing histidine kinase [Solirubrobacterales bacterium]
MVSALRIAGERIVLPDAPDDRSPDTQIWVFQGRRAIEQPHSAIDDTAADSLAPAAPRLRDVAATSTRLYALPVVQGGRRLGAVVAGVSLVPYEQTRRTALIASLLLAAAVLIAVVIAARWLIDRALRPVAEMTRQAAEWSEHDLERRFSLGPPRDELTQLASTLDGLLDRLAASLRHEQRLSSEISHELRTPLANIVAETQYALRHGRQTDESRATLEHILHSAKQLGRTLDTLMAAARSQLAPGHATSDALACARAALAAIDQEAAARLQTDVLAPRGGVRVAIEPELVTRILAPLVENAARHARRAISVTVEPDGEMVRFVVEDDGPGLPDEAREVIFEPGHRSRSSAAATATVSPGAGLGLALCRRLARTAGGEVHAQPSETGAMFVVRLPAAGT